MTATLHICYSRKDAQRIVPGKCPTCARRTFFYEWFQVWYGWHSTCLKCGDAWADGEMLERPFRPRWRKDAIAYARKAWRAFRANGGKPDDWERDIDTAVRPYLTEGAE